AEVLSRTLPSYTRDRMILCLGMLADKEREKVVDLLVPFADEVIITKPDSPRAGDWTGLAKIAEKHSKPVICIEDPKEAVAKAFKRLGPKDMLCVTGSLYMLADAREALLKILKKVKLDLG
ncbi:MAG: bifunctional folylpolyglutamate synthase/dihydrofolate synthase, partial [Desulfitobacteriaceae bacterium]